MTRASAPGEPQRRGVEAARPRRMSVARAGGEIDHTREPTKLGKVGARHVERYEGWWRDRSTRPTRAGSRFGFELDTPGRGSPGHFRPGER